MINKKEIVKSFVLQHDQSDCGVACLLSLINYYKGEGSLEILRELSGTNTQGTTLLGLYQTANKIGFNAQGCEADINSLITHNSPVILHVLMNERLNHYVVCYGYKNERFIIGDPGKGIIEYTKEELEKIWVSHKCLTLTPTEKFENKKDVKQFKRSFLAGLIKDDIPLLSISLVFGIIVSVLGMVMAIFSQKLIDDILPSNDSKRLIIGVLLIFILLLARVGFSNLREFLLLRQGRDFNNRIIKSFYASLLYLPKSFFDTRKIGDLVARLNDTGRLQKVLNKVVGDTVIDSLMVVTSLVFLYIYSWQVGVVASLTLPICFVIIYKYNSRIIASQKEVMASYAFNESNYINTLNGVSTIKNFNKQTHFSTVNQFIYGDFQNKTFNLGKINIRLSILAGTISVFFLITILSLSSYYVIEGFLSTGELMAVIGISSSLIPSILNLSLISIPINEAKIAFERMYELINIEKETNKQSNHVEVDFESLFIDNISFRFPGRKSILKNVSISLTKGELISIVGESGSGKSTLAQILQGFYVAETGQIRINNRYLLSDISTENWRRVLGVVPQDIHLFNGTVFENICLDNKYEELNQIVSFCEKYGFDKFINELPNGYLTIVGEEGVNLSGGQKQIIAFARALYCNPKLLILDEATSALDRNTESFVIELLHKLKQDMAIFFITHRLHHLRNFSDRIYVLNEGEIIAGGTHEEVLRSGNIYSDYWKEVLYDTNVK